MVKDEIFKALLKVGQDGENIAKCIIRQRFRSIIRDEDQPSGYFPYYDFITSQGVKYEVKTDIRAGETGNICLEYANYKGEPSGLSLTTADFYFFIFDNKYIMVDVDVLRTILKDEIKHIKDIKGFTSHFYLIPINILRTYPIYHGDILK